GLHDQRGVRQRGKLHHPDALGKRLLQIGGHLQGKARFAGAAGACQGDQGSGGKSAPQFASLLFAANEAGELPGQIVGRMRGREGRGGRRLFQGCVRRGSGRGARSLRAVASAEALEEGLDLGGRSRLKLIAQQEAQFAVGLGNGSVVSCIRQR